MESFISLIHENKQKQDKWESIESTISYTFNELRYEFVTYYLKKFRKTLCKD